MVVVSVDNRRVLSVREAVTGVFSTAWGHRKLILRLAGREILARYKGSLLGILWAGINPLLMLGVYTFIFSGVFRMRWGGQAGSTGQFALLVFSGLILFNLFSECIIRAPGLMLENVSYIKKVVFPLEILPYVQLVVGLFGAAISFVVLAAIYPFVFGWPPVTCLAVPLLLVPLSLLILGVSWFLASVGVFLRDVRQIVGILVTIVMFMSPVFYPIDMVPEPYRQLLSWGPLAQPMEQLKDLLFWGRQPDWASFAGYGLLSLVIAAGGFWWFMRTRKAFADVV